MDIRGPHFADGHYYLHHSQQYSAAFESTKWIENLFTTMLCSHTMLMNGSPPKTTDMAPMGGLFGSQQRPNDNVGASDNDARNTASKVNQFGQPTNQFPPPPGYC